MKDTHQKYDAERLRQTPIVDVIGRLGGTEHGTKSNYRSRRFRIGSQTFVVAAERNIFRDVDSGSGSRGAINFLVGGLGYSYMAALEFLGGPTTCGPNPPIAVPSLSARRSHTHEPVPEHDPRAWFRVKAYLVGMRAFSAAVVDEMRASDLLRAFATNIHAKSGRVFELANCAFIHHSLDGNLIACSVRGTSSKSYKSYRGPLAAELVPAFVFGEGAEAWLVESAIEAVSVVDLFPDVRAVSLNGDQLSAASPSVIAAIGGRSVVIATNRDVGGDRSANRIQAIHPTARREQPLWPNSDWNMMLQDRRKQVSSTSK